VYAERFRAGPHGGRINGDTINTRSGFAGHTNANTDEHIHDISQIVARR